MAEAVKADEQIYPLRGTDLALLVFGVLKANERAGRAERKYHREKRLSEHNPKTGALSHVGMLRKWKEFVRASKHQAHDDGKSLSDYKMIFIFGDTTGLKGINRLYGGHIGDRLLRTVARKIQRGILRAEDFLAMPKGDEIYMGIRYDNFEVGPDILAAQIASRAKEKVAASRVKTDGGKIIHPEIRLYHLVISADTNFRKLTKDIEILMRDKERGRELDQEALQSIGATK